MNDDYLCDRGLKVNSNSVEESWKFATRYFCADNCQEENRGLNYLNSKCSFVKMDEKFFNLIIARWSKSELRMIFLLSAIHI